MVFEAAPVQLFSKAKESFNLEVTASAATESRVPQPPDIGFVGRDETLLKLDRAFDNQSVVPLHAYAGSGKTSTAEEFARWYCQTGGSVHALVTSFEVYSPLALVVDQLEHAFKRALSKRGIEWLKLTGAERRDIALEILHQIPVLWIWDNVEPIAGFPAGDSSDWTETEQNELLDFLRAARGTNAKFLLTSRREERGWLHDLPARIELRPMSLHECVQMTEKLVKKFGRRLEDVEDWRPLFRFAQGNPLTLAVLARQVLRERLTSREQIANFVRKVEAGGVVFEDEAEQVFGRFVELRF